jgi:hypothetical protein
MSIFFLLAAFEPTMASINIRLSDLQINWVTQGATKLFYSRELPCPEVGIARIPSVDFSNAWDGVKLSAVYMSLMVWWPVYWVLSWRKGSLVMIGWAKGIFKESIEVRKEVFDLLKELNGTEGEGLWGFNETLVRQKLPEIVCALYGHGNGD